MNSTLNTSTCSNYNSQQHVQSLNPFASINRGDELLKSVIKVVNLRWGTVYSSLRPIRCCEKYPLLNHEIEACMGVGTVGPHRDGEEVCVGLIGRVEHDGGPHGHGSCAGCKAANASGVEAS